MKVYIVQVLSYDPFKPISEVCPGEIVTASHVIETRVYSSEEEFHNYLQENGGFSCSIPEDLNDFIIVKAAYFDVVQLSEAHLFSE